MHKKSRKDKKDLFWVMFKSLNGTNLTLGVSFFLWFRQCKLISLASENKQNLWSSSEKCFISKNYTLWFNWTNCTDFVNAIKDNWFILAKLLTKGTMRLDLASLAMRLLFLSFQILRCADFAIFDPFFSFRRVEEISVRGDGMHIFEFN